MKMIKFNVASINRCTEAEGPYKRLCIWFQGCNIHCRGCCNPDYQAIVPGHIMSLEELMEIIQTSKKEYDIEGVTYTGGEPTLQRNLPALTAKIQKMGLGVICFTGRQYEEIAQILAGCDAVLDGPYMQKHRDEKRRIIGSENQRILCLTDRYQNCIEDWFSVEQGRTVEVNFGAKTILNGDCL